MLSAIAAGSESDRSSGQVLVGSQEVLQESGTCGL